MTERSRPDSDDATDEVPSFEGQVVFKGDFTSDEHA